MVAYFDTISPSIAEWAMAQQIFFTASAPLAGKHINLSPKGLPASTFSILGENQAAYVDATGSGNETISHINERGNGRITIMFCSFGSSPRILRFFCTGTVIEWDSPRFETLLEKMGKARLDGARAVILLDVWKVQTSCGYGVPRLGLDEEKGAMLQDRETLGHWAHGKVEKNEMNAYRVKNNVESLDGLPGLRTARKDNGEVLWLGELKATARRIAKQREALGAGLFLGLLVWLLTVRIQTFLLN
jgi:hypothetical protein